MFMSICNFHRKHMNVWSVSLSVCVVCRVVYWLLSFCVCVYAQQHCHIYPCSMFIFGLNADCGTIYYYYCSHQNTYLVFVGGHCAAVALPLSAFKSIKSNTRRIDDSRAPFNEAITNCSFRWCVTGVMSLLYSHTHHCQRHRHHHAKSFRRLHLCWRLFFHRPTQNYRLQKSTNIKVNLFVFTKKSVRARAHERESERGKKWYAAYWRSTYEKRLPLNEMNKCWLCSRREKRICKKKNSIIMHWREMATAYIVYVVHVNSRMAKNR